MKTKLLVIALFLLPCWAQAQEVEWKVISGGVMLPATATPITDGRSSLTPTCGTIAGPYTVEASIPDTNGDGQRETVLFTGKCDAGPAMKIAIAIGNNQIGIVGENLGAACVVEFRDQYNNITSTVGIAVP